MMLQFWTGMIAAELSQNRKRLMESWMDGFRTFTFNTGQPAADTYSPSSREV